MIVPSHYQITGRRAATVAQSIESGISSRDLAPGELLPPIRELARALGVSPGTVAAAYRLLAQRGLTTSDRRRGTRIRPWYHEALDSAPAPPPHGKVPAGDGGATDLASGNPDPALLPDLRSVMGRLEYVPARYGDPALDARLESVATPQLLADGLPDASLTCSFGALDGIRRVLTTSLRHGDRVAVEDPGWPSLLDGIRRWGFIPVPAPLDDEGPLPGRLWDALAGGAKAVVITSRAQNPTGAALSRDRAAEIASLLARYPGTLLVEDDHGHAIADPDSRLHSVVTASGTPHGPWAFVRSAAKAYGPDLRVAVVAGDPTTVARVELDLASSAGWVSHINQQLVAQLWSDTDVTRHVREAAAAYRARREALLRSLGDHGLGAHGRSGLNVWIPLPSTPSGGDGEAAVIADVMGGGWRVGAGAAHRLVSPPAIRVTTAALAAEDSPAVAQLLARAIGRPTGPGY
jgi:DNA-binding transcriptional MocR family regulator